MSHLQQILDEKWPDDKSLPFATQSYRQMKREAFTEGYNAAMEELGRSPILSGETWENAKIIRDSKGSLCAVKYLKDNGIPGTLLDLRNKVNSL